MIHLPGTVSLNFRPVRHPPSNHIGQRQTGTSPWIGAKIMHMQATDSELQSSAFISQTPAHRFTLPWQCGAVVQHCVGSSWSLLILWILLEDQQALCRGRCQPYRVCMSPGRFHLRAWRSSVNLDSESWSPDNTFKIHDFYVKHPVW